MEVSSAAAGNAYMIRQAISLAMMRKTMGIDANVVSELLPDAAAVSAEALEVPAGDVGGNIDISV